MHYIAVAFVLLSFPALVAWLKNYPRQRHWAYFGLGILPFTVTHWNLDGALISWAMWPGYVKGLILTLIDTLALAIIVTHRRPSGLPPLSGFVIAYLLASVLSIAFSDVRMASVFYAFQLLRVLIVVTAVAKIAPDEHARNRLIAGLAFGIAYQAGFAIWQKLNGVFQVSGTMGHQNLLGMMSHFVILPLLAVMLGGGRKGITILGVGSGLVVVALGASRGTIGFGLLGIALVLILSLARRSTPQKWRMVGIAALAIAIASPFMLQSIQKRLGQLAQSDGYDERAAFERTAKAIWHDNPMGVGANRYVVVANSGGYSARAGVAWVSTSRSAHVHNTYLLVAAETGWAGLVTLITMFVGVVVSGLRFAFQNRRDPRGDIVLGCTVAIIVSAVHCFYEWNWVWYGVQYLFAITVGVIGGMIRIRAIEKRRMRRQAPAPQPVELAPAGALAIGTGEAVPTRVEALTKAR